jgi:hypothetical protein
MAKTSPDLGTHMLLTTFRKSGVPVSTPVWNVPLVDGRIGMWTGAGTGKWKRLRRNPAVTVQACSARGRAKPGAPVYSGTASILPEGPEADAIRAQIRARYGRFQIALVKRISRMQGRLTPEEVFGDTIIMITLDSDEPDRRPLPDISEETGKSAGSVRSK